MKGIFNPLKRIPLVGYFETGNETLGWQKCGKFPNCQSNIIILRKIPPLGANLTQKRGIENVAHRKQCRRLLWKIANHWVVEPEQISLWAFDFRIPERSRNIFRSWSTFRLTCCPKISRNLFPSGWASGKVGKVGEKKLTTHLHLLPKLGKGGTVPPLSHVSSWRVASLSTMAISAHHWLCHWPLHRK